MTSAWDPVRVDTLNDTIQHEFWARGLDPAKYIRASDGRIEMRLTQEKIGSFPIPPVAQYDFAQVIVVDDP